MTDGRKRAWPALLLLLGGLSLATRGPRAAAEEQPMPQQVFERRIMPIFRSLNPSSRAQCHGRAALGEEDHVGQAEATSRGLDGNGLKTVVPASQVRR